MAAKPRPGNGGPLLVAVEGIDGSGKTTLTAALAGGLARQGVSVSTLREPSGGPAGQLLRSLSAGDGRHPMMLALLSAADRFDQQARIAEQECDLVISDRYYLSGLAYHAADGISQALYQQLNDGIRRPDLYLFLHLDPRTAAARLGSRSRDRWERGPVAAAVPRAYQDALRLVHATENARVARLDAARAACDVLAQALHAVVPLTARAEGAHRA